MKPLLPLLLIVTVLLAVPVRAAAQTPDEQIAAASALFDAKRFAEAAQKLSKFLAANPRSARAGAAALALGRCRTELGQWTQAVPAYEKAIGSRDPDVVTLARLGLGEAALRTGQYDKSAAALNAAVQADLTPEQAALAYFWLAQANFSLKRFPAAEEAYLTVVEDYPQSRFAANAQFGAALAALRQEKTDAARERLQAMTDRYPGSADRPQALLLLAQMDLDAKRYAEARRGFETLLQAKPDAATWRAADEGLVRALLELEDYAAASARLQAALARMPAADPQRRAAYLTLGHTHYRQKQYVPALAAYREAAKSSEGAVAGESLYWAANALLALGRPAEAGAQFAQVVSRYPKHALTSRAALRAGDAFLAAKKRPAAASAYKTVVQKYAKTPEADTARRALAELAETASSPAEIASALETAPAAERARATLRLARLHLAAKKYAAAATPLMGLLKGTLEPETASEAQYLLGLAYEGQGKAALAAAAFSQSLRLNPASEWAADAGSRLSWLYLELKQPANAEKTAQALLARTPEGGSGGEAEQQARLALLQAQLDQRRWDAALETAQALLEGSPSPETVATVRFTQAWVSEKQNKPEEALPLWEQLVTEHPRSRYAAEALLHIGDAHAKAERYDAARERYAALLAGFPQSPLEPEARFKLGTVLYNRGRHAASAEEWDRVTANRQAGAYAPEALYWAGVAWDKAGKKAAAIQRLSRLVTQYPKHTRAANARTRLAALKAVAR